MKKDYFIECSLQYLENVNSIQAKREILYYFLGIDTNENSNYMVNILYKRLVNWFECLK